MWADAVEMICCTTIIALPSQGRRVPSNFIQENRNTTYPPKLYLNHIWLWERCRFSPTGRLSFLNHQKVLYMAGKFYRWKMGRGNSDRLKARNPAGIHWHCLDTIYCCEQQWSAPEQLHPLVLHQPGLAQLPDLTHCALSHQHHRVLVSHLTRTKMKP